jgi:hypothetical protein
MPERDERTEEPPEDKGNVNTRQLEKLSKVAADAAQAKQWRARQNGMLNADEPSEVRNLSDNAEARAQAEAAMQQMMAKPTGKRRGR